MKVSIIFLFLGYLLSAQNTITFFSDFSTHDIKSFDLNFSDKLSSNTVYESDFSFSYNLDSYNIDGLEYSKEFIETVDKFIFDTSHFDTMSNGFIVFPFSKKGKLRFKDDYILHHERNILKRLLPPIPGENFMFCPDF
ncbi:hypothetical protein [Winogradskyella sp.]|uniref:hypothetical protein n=1 Tax=Winogradskyella sp. TaxID=1883156 RepID=UPI00262FC0C1|nr:hypothetical protein [Winogradskyella sp.]